MNPLQYIASLIKKTKSLPLEQQEPVGTPAPAPRPSYVGFDDNLDQYEADYAQAKQGLAKPPPIPTQVQNDPIESLLATLAGSASGLPGVQARIAGIPNQLASGRAAAQDKQNDLAYKQQIDSAEQVLGSSQKMIDATLDRRAISEKMRQTAEMEAKNNQTRVDLAELKANTGLIQTLARRGDQLTVGDALTALSGLHPEWDEDRLMTAAQSLYQHTVASPSARIIAATEKQNSDRIQKEVKQDQEILRDWQDAPYDLRLAAAGRLIQAGLLPPTSDPAMVVEKMTPAQKNMEARTENTQERTKKLHASAEAELEKLKLGNKLTKERIDLIHKQVENFDQEYQVRAAKAYGSASTTKDNNAKRVALQAMAQLLARQISQIQSTLFMQSGAERERADRRIKDLQGQLEGAMASLGVVVNEIVLGEGTIGGDQPGQPKNPGKPLNPGGVKLEFNQTKSGNKYRKVG